MYYKSHKTLYGELSFNKNFFSGFESCYGIIIIIIIIHIYIAHYSHCALMCFLKKTVIPLLNTHRSYTEKMKVFSRFFIIVMESALWIFRGSSFHNLAAEVPKRRFPNRMDLFLYGTSDVNAVDRKDLLGM